MRAAPVAVKVAGWQLFLEPLRHECLRPFTALTLLAKCGNVKFEHLAKSLHPDVTLESAFAFDEIVDDTAKAILEATTEPIHQPDEGHPCTVESTVKCHAFFETEPACRRGLAAW